MIFVIIKIKYFVIAKFKIMEKQIIETIKSLFSKVDERDWQGIKNMLADDVDYDYSSLTGIPLQKLPSNQIVGTWKDLLPGFDRTHHVVDHFTIGQFGKDFVAKYNGWGEHFLGDDVWKVEGTFETHVLQSGNDWKIISHKFNFEKQHGNKHLPEKAQKRVKEKTIRKIEFESNGLTLRGNLHVPVDFADDNVYQGIVITGSWLTVKEQMADFYATKIAHEGYVALTFDFSTYGESDGEIRNFEQPHLKSREITDAVAYLKSLPFISAEEVGGLAICASSGYMTEAIINGADIKALTLVAPWLHNHELVAPLYGEEKGVAEKIAASKEAEAHYKNSGKVDYVSAVSKTDKNAAMFGPFDYYLDEKRGAIKEWENKFAVMAWQEWLEYDPIPLAKELSIPTLLIHSKKAAIPEGAELYYKNLKSDKNIIWLKNDPTQFDLYDQEPYTSIAVREAVKWYEVYLAQNVYSTHL